MKNLPTTALPNAIVPPASMRRTSASRRAKRAKIANSVEDEDALEVTDLALAEYEDEALAAWAGDEDISVPPSPDFFDGPASPAPVTPSQPEQSVTPGVQRAGPAAPRPRQAAAESDASETVRPKPGPRGRRVQKPPADVGDGGLPSLYTCGRKACDGVLLLPGGRGDGMAHGHRARCASCATLRGYCATCDGFFDEVRVVCNVFSTDHPVSRNGHHPAGHPARVRFGGRRLRLIPPSS